MVSEVIVTVPDVGVEGEVEVIEISVSAGDSVAIDESIVVVESDKATVEVPSSDAGKVKEVLVSIGDKVKQGDPLVSLATEADKATSTVTEEAAASTPATGASDKTADDAGDSGSSKNETVESKQGDGEGVPSVVEVRVPDLGGVSEVEVIELSVSAGDVVGEEESLLVLESDKATMDIPSPYQGELKQFLVSVGDKVSEGDLIAEIVTVAGANTASSSAPTGDPSPENSSVKQNSSTAQETIAETTGSHVQKAVQNDAAASLQGSSEGNGSEGKRVHAGPAVRKLARELGADLTRVQATGPRNRILKVDLHAYIKAQVTNAQSGIVNAGVPKQELPDFSKFGDIESVPMSKIHRVTATNMQQSWSTIPHVTQFDEADITELEEFRTAQKHQAEKRGVKLTPVAFLLKACAYVLESLPQFNVSIDVHNGVIIQKKYVHLGIAVDTPSGLVVPVIRDVNKKSIWALAEECQQLAKRAQERQLKPLEMQGGCFTISSLGGIGGTAFTPIVNSPEVAILGVSKSSYKPVYDGSDFVPRLMLPLSLSYDHRAVNGADAARFTSLLARVLSDMREMLL